MFGPALLQLHTAEYSKCFQGLSQCSKAHPLGPSVPHVSHQEPQQLGVVLVTMAHTVFIALTLVFLHHLDKHNKSSFTSVNIRQAWWTVNISQTRIS